MTTYSRTDRLAAIQKAGFKNPLTALAVSLAEFGEARDINVQSQSDVVSNGIREPSFGPWQIHLPSHPDVTQSCAMDLTCSTQKAFDISKGGTDFGAWSAYNNGSYNKFLAELYNVPEDLLRRIRTSLGAIMVGISKGGGDFTGKGDEIVSQLQKIYPDVPEATLRDIVGTSAQHGATNITNAPVVGGAAQAVDKLQAAGNPLEFLKGLFASENLWRGAFVILGSALIFGGARMYLHEPVREGVAA